MPAKPTVKCGSSSQDSLLLELKEDNIQEEDLTRTNTQTSRQTDTQTSVLSNTHTSSQTNTKASKATFNLEFQTNFLPSCLPGSSSYCKPTSVGTFKKKTRGFELRLGGLESYSWYKLKLRKTRPRGGLLNGEEGLMSGWEEVACRTTVGSGWSINHLYVFTPLLPLLPSDLT